MKAKKLKLLALSTAILGAAVLSPIGAKPVGAIAAGSTQVVFYLDKTQAYVNGGEVTLDSPATSVNGRSYLPAKFLGDALGMTVEWDAVTKTVDLITPDHKIKLDTNNNVVWVNGVKQANNDIALIINGRIMVKLAWLCDYMGAKYLYTHEQKKVEVTYTNSPDGIYDVNKGSNPVAKFGTNKNSYAVGEPITYTNLSYDPDSDSISLSWEGRQSAFFEAGTYPVTLVVTDKNGNKSAPFTKNIVVTDSVFMTQFEHDVYASKPGDLISASSSLFNSSILTYPQASKSVQYDSRRLVVSDSPETFTELGILYQDTVNGKGRLYADHINGMKQIVNFGILATNDTNEPITIKTTNKGEVYPSIYAMLIGTEATVDFLIGDKNEESITVQPGETIVYKQFPQFYAGQGVNVIYDVETDGEITFTFAVDDKVGPQMLSLKKLDFNGHVRGTFDSADINMTLDLASNGLNKPQRLVIGDGIADPFLQGYDPQRGTVSTLNGNYGAVYNISIKNPPKMAVMMMARGGSFKGAFKVNGNIVKTPTSGILTPFDGLVTIAKTKGTESTLDIQFSPPAGSNFPINLVFLPLDSRTDLFN